MSHKIILNGRAIVIDQQTLSYAEIQRLVGVTHHLTITFRSKNRNISGTLSPGQMLAIGDGIIINAMNTSAA